MERMPFTSYIKYTLLYVYCLQQRLYCTFNNVVLGLVYRGHPVLLHFKMHCGNSTSVREAINKKKSQNCGHFPYGGGAQPHSIAFGGVFPNITEAI